MRVRKKKKNHRQFEHDSSFDQERTGSALQVGRDCFLPSTTFYHSDTLHPTQVTQVTVFFFVNIIQNTIIQIKSS